jgi:ABC-type transport system involved in cytochrome c biogenesis permease subunit
MNWLYYPGFYYVITLLWTMAFVLFFRVKYAKSARAGFVLAVAGTMLLVVFTVMFWVKLNRPPLRTLGETRLWYSLFLPLIGLAVYVKWRFGWFLQFSIALAILFLTINLIHTETYDKTLMPALQSIWFVPHVIVYIFAYALLAASSFVAIKEIYRDGRIKPQNNAILLADNLVYIGFGFLTLGLLFGALWAKEAWGDYWTWDPKETWALLTWLGYLIYIHIRQHLPHRQRMALWILAAAFIILLFCWFGINYLPSAQNSVHTYSG